MTVGLTLGKFAPLHRGHQLVIETALAEVDHLIVIVYDAPETTTIPLPVRAGWIRDLYPAAAVIEAWAGPTQVGDTEPIKIRHEGYVLDALRDHPSITHFFSSEFYGEHMSAALGAEDRRVDQDRVRIPTSGTAIRDDPYAHRHLIDPLVYRDLITKIVFLGAPSTGKTSICEKLAADHGTVWMPEYGREYWEKYEIDRRLTPEQLLEIGEGHLEIEDELLLNANRYLFVDTDATTTYMFALYYHGVAHPRLVELADAARSRYDLAFLCLDDIPYQEQWERSGDTHRWVFQKQTRADLVERNIPYISLPGSLDQRVARVNGVLDGFDKWLSIGDQLLARAAAPTGEIAGG
jgi:NadR type nicotinamide-nucleotide adenylyltransferase